MRRVIKAVILTVVFLFALGMFGCSQQIQQPGGPESVEHPFGGRPGGPQEGFQEGPPQAMPGQPPRDNRNEFALPPIDANLPLPNPPEGQLITKQLGDVEISYFSTAIIRGMTESGVDFFITLKNKGSSAAVISFTPGEELAKTVPKWNLHFFSFQDSPITIEAGSEKKLWYFASLDSGSGEFTLNFQLANGASKIDLLVKFGATEDQLRGKETSFILGKVKDEDGKPIANVRVDAVMNCGRMNFQGNTDDSGRYFITLLGMEDINAIYGGRELACDSRDYYLSVSENGYEYYFKENVAPTRKAFAEVNITLEKREEADTYSLAWEKLVDDVYGFFWVKPSSDWSVFAATQAKHPPELNKPTNFYLFDSQGNILWKQPTGNECWSIDISADGSKVVAGCHDGKVYAVDRSGKSLWTFDAGAMVRSACISKDGKKVLSGAIQRLYLFNADDGTKQEVPWINEWFRNCQFYKDGSGFVAGARTLAGFDSNSNRKWSYVIGEFPMFLAVDNNKDVFAAGKSRTLFSFDADGNLRWKHRIPDHVVGAGAVTPDGSRIALGTVGGMVYLFDGNGNLLWKRATSAVWEEGGAVGHNAVAISADGSRIIVGTAPSNCVIVFNEKGTQLWRYCAEANAQSKDALVGVTNVQISSDKSKIIAAYGDNYMREFVGG